MKQFLLFLLAIPVHLLAQPFSKTEIARWEQQSKNVSIIRDNWGVPHVYGKKDADAVFGLLYAQCEDDFRRVEMNYIEKLGRKSEVFGIGEMYNDLYVRLIIDSTEAIADYQKAPQWLKQLLNAYADGINYYLYKHPEAHPLLLNRFQPWFPLLWTDGSIGAISTGDITELDVKNLYSGAPSAVAAAPKVFVENSSGSNGFAIAPSRTENGNAILYINPHVTFYFRPEVQMSSEEGLAVYGAVTWGQFFIYQGFNAYCGWMHTSSNVDVADMYIEKVSSEKGKMYYRYNQEKRKLGIKNITIRYINENSLQSKTFTTYFTHHGPIMGQRNGEYISVRSNNRMMNGLIQSWLRTKANGFAAFKKTMDLKANTSNNTVFADNKGNIAYWHGDFVPKRNPAYNWGKAVDGSTSATEWKGLHNVDEIVHVYNPASGWIQNCNSTPFTVSGNSSPNKNSYPAYMAPDGENFRGINAVRVLSRENKMTIDKTIAAGYDRYLSAFRVLVPALVKAFDEHVQPTDTFFQPVKKAVNILRNWNYYSDTNSVATTIAVEWAQQLNASIRKIYVDEDEPDQVSTTKTFAANAKPEELLIPLMNTLKNLQAKYGTWEVKWGSINRFQRINNGLNQSYDDSKISYAVPFASALWGMLPSYNSRLFPGTNQRYGVSGNSFICAVEFGPKVKAKSLLAGGNSGNPNSPHFTDQLEMYTKGQFKEVLFYKEDVLKHAERTYHPGE